MTKQGRFRMRPHNKKERNTIKMLVKEGESIFGSSNCFGNVVQEYVQAEMIKRGLRVKVHLPEEEGGWIAN